MVEQRPEESSEIGKGAVECQARVSRWASLLGDAEVPVSHLSPPLQAARWI